MKRAFNFFEDGRNGKSSGTSLSTSIFSTLISIAPVNISWVQLLHSTISINWWFNLVPYFDHFLVFLVLFLLPWLQFQFWWMRVHPSTHEQCRWVGWSQCGHTVEWTLCARHLRIYMWRVLPLTNSVQPIWCYCIWYTWGLNLWLISTVKQLSDKNSDNNFNHK